VVSSLCPTNIYHVLETRHPGPGGTQL
jgi:hypothetical protein